MFHQQIHGNFWRILNFLNDNVPVVSNRRHNYLNNSGITKQTFIWFSLHSRQYTCWHIYATSAFQTLNQKTILKCFQLTTESSNILMLSTLGKNFSRHHLKISLIFPENRFWHFMHIVSNFPRKQVLTFHAFCLKLHEMSNPVFWEKYEKCHQFVISWICPESSKG